MEFASGHEGRVKAEKRSEPRSSSGGGGDDHPFEQEIDLEVPTMVDRTGPSASSTKKEEAEELESAKAEMGEVREANQRLKQYLERVTKDYRRLQMQFRDIVQKKTKHQSDDHKLSLGHEYALHHHHHDHRQETVTEESELVSLSLGRSVLPPKNNEKRKAESKALVLKDHEECKEDLALGLDCKFEASKPGSTNEIGVPNISSPVNSSDEAPSKVLKTVRDAGEEEASQHNNAAKKARVCVRARCDTPTMNDGCQWRKYGQKIAKGNPCPRAYYRCTVASSCPVRKQVQRCAQDMSVLITTYEGIHNHPLALSATAFASTTSAAASMLLSGSSTSRLASLPLSTAATTATTAITDLHGLNFYQSDDFKSKQIYLSNPTLPSSSSSSSHSHPTITLDLTTTTTTSTTTNPLYRFTSNYNPPRSLPNLSSTSLNFNSTNIDFLSNSSNGSVFSSINLARPTMENMYHQLPHMQKNSTGTTPLPSHALPADTIAAATKAITADPKFQSALAVALTSIIGAESGGGGGGRGAENLPHKMKWGDLFPASSSP